MIDVVLPCLGKAAALPGVLAGLSAGDRAIVAGNGSTDGSAQTAASLGANVIHVPQWGFGSAGMLCASATQLSTVDAVLGLPAWKAALA